MPTDNTQPNLGLAQGLFGSPHAINPSGGLFGTPQAPTTQPSAPTDYSKATFNPQYQAKMPEIKSTIVSLRGQGIADDKIFSYLQQKGVLQTPQAPTTPSEPSLGSRVGSDIQSAAGGVSSAISGTGSYAGKSIINRATGAVSEAASAPLKVASELLPSGVRQGISDVGQAASSVINAIGDKVSDIKPLQQWASDPKNAEAVKSLSDVLGTASNLGNIAGNILAAGGGAKLADAGTKVATNLAGSASEKLINVGSAAGEKIGLTPKTPGAVGSAGSSLQDALDMTKEPLSKKGSIQALEKSGLPGGAQVSGKLGTIDTTVSPRDTTIAQYIQPYITKGDPIGSITNINQEISRAAEQDIRPFLQKNPAPFNLKQINSYIKTNTEIPNYIKADPVLQKTYDLTRQSMLDEIAKQPKNMEGLWDARIAFDNVAQKQGVNLNTISEKASVIKQAVLDTRRAVNKYIVDNTPNADNAFKSGMDKLTNLYEGRSRIATANYKMLGTNALQRWIKANPAKAKAAGLVVGSIAGGEVLKHFLPF